MMFTNFAITFAIRPSIRLHAVQHMLQCITV